jgi:hypothetical protein
MPTSSALVSDDLKFPLAAALLPLAIQNLDLFAVLLADVTFWRGDAHVLPEHQPHHSPSTIEPTKPRKVGLPVDALFYRSEAIAHIRHKIFDLEKNQDSKRGPDDALIIAIIHLMSLDVNITQCLPCRILHRLPRSLANPRYRSIPEISRHMPYTRPP